VGILLGFSFVEPKDFRDLQAHVQTLASDYDINLPQLPGFSIPEIWKFNNDGREFQVGEAMKERGLSAEFPVVLIPGIVSTVRQINIIHYQTSQLMRMSSGLRILVHGP
jgi:phospholipid:diacylglycerol acyltransferase